MNESNQPRDDAIAIWRAGVDAVRSSRLVQEAIRVCGDKLVICDQRYPLSSLGNIAVVGTGKAGAGMAAAVEETLGPDVLQQKVVGWLNVPEDCIQPLAQIHLHAARPPGLNEPTAAGVEGATRILQIVSELKPDDLCLVLLSGGGSALLPAPRRPITLEDKQSVTRFLMECGATIDELNKVRKRLSLIKGGGLARAAAGAGQVVTLIISDVVGDPLDIIASGPTYPDLTTDAEAIAVLKKFAAAPPDVPQRVLDYLHAASLSPAPQSSFPQNVSNYVIGNNATALAAAAIKAEQLGYHVISLGSDNRGQAKDEGRSLAEKCRDLRDRGEQAGLPACILSGGEPVVRLAKTDKPRRGGRNQEFVLAGLDALREDGMERILLLSGGTDGEDGPTDAAGAWADARLLRLIRENQIDPRPYLEINDSYTFFEQTGGLVKTGPTHTNVMDLRVAIVSCDKQEPTF